MLEAGQLRDRLGEGRLGKKKKKTRQRACRKLNNWKTGWTLVGWWLVNTGAGDGRKPADRELADWEMDLRLAITGKLLFHSLPAACQKILPVLVPPHKGNS